MKYLCQVSIIFSFFFLSCTQLGPLPPGFNRDAARNEEALVLVSRYLAAKKARPNCKNFSELLKDSKDFPLPRLINLRKKEACRELSKEGEGLSSWENTYYFKEALKVSLLGDIEGREQSEALYLLAQQSFRAFEYEEKTEDDYKIKLLEKAYKLSKSESQKEKISSSIGEISPTHPLAKRPKKEGPAYLLSLAKAQLKNRDFLAARKNLKKILESEYDFLDQFEARKLFSQSFKVEGKREAYGHTLKDAQLQYSPDSYEHLYFFSLWARHYWTINQTKMARKMVENKISQISFREKEIPHIEEYVKLLKVLAGIYRELKMPRREESALLRAYNLSEKRAELYELKSEIAFSLGLSHLINGRLQNSIYWFSRINFNEDAPLEFFRGQFFLASALKKTKDKRANAIFTNLASRYPFSYYGILAAIELEEQFYPLFSRDQTSEERVRDNILEWLLAFGENSLASSYLHFSLKKNFLPGRRDPKKMAALFFRVGEYDSVMKWAMEARAEKVDLYSDISIAKWAYPLAFFSQFKAAAQNYDLDPALMLAIARQESAFQEFARSPADAFGLMQITLPTALALGESLSYQDLFHKEQNLSLGASLLQRLIKRREGDFIKVVASYNASSKAVDSWYEKYDSRDLVIFVELIPYRETRNYIKSVFRNFLIYRRIVAKEAFSFSFPPPLYPR